MHVQRVPYSGRVVDIHYNKGKRYPAFQSKASVENEANMVSVETNEGIIITRQIAGMITRRIVCGLTPNQFVKTGDRLGVIIFGSRVEIYMPQNAKLCVNIGDKVKAGETLVSTFDRKYNIHK